MSDVLKQALDALESLFSGQVDEQRGQRCADAIVALRAAIEQAAVASKDVTEATAAIMEQAQVFASAWALVGGKFDSGSGLDDANLEKDELRQMVSSLAEMAARLPVAQPAYPQLGYGQTMRLNAMAWTAPFTGVAAIQWKPADLVGDAAC